MDDVAVYDDVLLALEPELAGIARAGFAAERDVILGRDHLGADEAALEIGVNDAGGLWRPRAARHRPGVRLPGTGSEERDEVEQRIARADQAVEPGLVQTVRGEIFAAHRTRQHGDLRLDLGRDQHAAGAFG